MPIEIRDIVTEEFQTDIQDSFALATGFGVVFLDREGRHIGKGGNFCKFCHAINETQAGSRACTLSNKHAIELALKTQKLSIYICHAGLVNIEIPLTSDGEHIGAITAGQVLCDDMTAYPKDDVDSTMDWLANAEYAGYYQEIEVMSKRKIEATTKALASISNYIMQTASYNKSRQDLLLYEKRQIELEHQLKLAELDALQKQVSPHFIFNIINSVSRMVSLGEYDTAGKMLDAFAHMMRYRLSNIQSTVTLKQEIAYIENYLSIQKIRFGPRIRYSIDCDEEAEDLPIPFFSLQPLVENSIEHGLLGLENGGEVRLRCRHHADCDEILLEDGGVGISAENLRSLRALLEDIGPRITQEHVGIFNSYSRLRHQYGERLQLQLDSRPGAGTTITITIRRG